MVDASERRVFPMPHVGWALAQLLAATLLFGCGGSSAPAADARELEASSEAHAEAEHANADDAAEAAAAETAPPADEESGTAASDAPGAADTPAETAPAAASPAPAADEPGETRTKEVIAETVLRHRQSVRDCYDIARQDQPELRGTLTVAFEIGATGKVRSAALNEARSTLRDPKLVACALQAFRQIRFPASSKGFDSLGNYPFDFRP